MKRDKSLAASVCAGCGHQFAPGDLYIEDELSGFIGKEPDPVVDGLVAEIFGAEKVRLCDACTQQGGDYMQLVYAEEE